MTDNDSDPPPSFSLVGEFKRACGRSRLWLAKKWASYRMPLIRAMRNPDTRYDDFVRIYCAYRDTASMRDYEYAVKRSSITGDVRYGLLFAKDDRLRTASPEVVNELARRYVGHDSRLSRPNLIEELIMEKRPDYLPHRNGVPIDP